MRGALLGPAFGLNETRATLDAAGARYETLGDDALIDAAAEALAAGEAVGRLERAVSHGGGLALLWKSIA